ncbi:hypothetical protein S7711_04715 [Stachybotrys chartarum IBT 7711]|uniref:FAS1 domain-containing protein n=1 Tax=Stachybotrys chartarum (strain CBS 109288 / IBT 7711) TaxID=1280523 RepID=A0A084AP04_STACB|nr:hypothetical protein S7711_04715 [Stachybotrys chartarum IBT 7711]KFA73042.1 hypothetical protein S40288_03243 [Stachybotrys chartarum IBT 40288]
MKTRCLVPLALAGWAAAQEGGNMTSLTDALAGRNDTLSLLGTLLATQPDLVETLGGLSNITLLAPSNDAITEFLGDMEVSDLDPNDVAALLTYHVLNGTYYASDIPEEAVFVPTLLTDDDYSTVTGGQVVEAMAEDDSVYFTSALRVRSTVEEANLNFTGGVIHIIDHVLNVPQNIVDTAIAAELSALVGAVQTADLGETLLGLEDITVFAPNNAAFQEIASLTGNLSTEVLGSILQYHVIAGTVAYSSTLSNTSVETVGGNSVNITITDGGVYVNEARVLIPDVLIANGVVHVIDSVLNPDSMDSSPDDTDPAFPGASSASDVPFTSDVPTPTEAPTGLATASEAQTTIATSVSEEAAVPMATGAIALGALFGGAAVLVNGL